MGNAGVEPSKVKATIFVSYSRHDGSFVENLCSALTAEGFHIVLDKHDIAPGEAWRERLDGLILSADAVVFVTTDAALKSEVCAWEVERTRELGKRLVPLVHGRLGQEPPAALAALNWIYSDDPGDGATMPASPSAKAIGKLSAALSADIKWVREHSRLTGRATEWANAIDDHKDELLLRLGEVQRARGWADLRPGNGAPSIPQVVVEFLDASERKERGDRDRLLRSIGRGFVKPVEQCLREERYDDGLRLLAAGLVLSEDSRMERVPEFRQLAARATAQSGMRRALVGYGDTVCDAEFSPDVSLVAAALANGVVEVRRIDGDASPRIMEGHVGEVTRVRFSPNGQHLVTAGADGTARLWDVSSASALGVLKKHDGRLVDADFSADGSSILTATDHGMAEVWSLSDRRRICAVSRKAIVSRSSEFKRAAFSPVAKCFATLCGDEVALWTPDEGKLIRRLSGRFVSLTNDQAFSTDGRILVCGAGSIVTWRVSDGRRLKEIIDIDTGFRSARFSPDRTHIVALAGDGTMRIYCASSGIAVGVHRHEDFRSSRSCGVSADGRWLLTIGPSTSVQVWDAMPASSFRRLVFGDTLYERAQFAEGARCVAVSRPGKSLDLFDTETGRRRFSTRIRGVLERVYALSPDGSRLALALNRGLVAICNLKSRRRVLAKSTDPTIIRSLEFSSDGSLILAGLNSGGVELWRADSGRRVKAFGGEELGIAAATFAPDNARIAAYSDEGVVRVWLATSGEELTAIECAAGHVDRLAWHPDGHLIFVGRAGATSILNVAAGIAAKVIAGELADISQEAGLLVTLTQNHACVYGMRDNSDGPEPYTLLQAHWSKQALVGAGFDQSGSRLWTMSDDGELRVRDISRLQRVAGPQHEVLAASLAQGRGQKSLLEGIDLLMKDAPEDLYGAYLAELTRDLGAEEANSLRDKIAKRAAHLAA